MYSPEEMERDRVGRYTVSDADLVLTLEPAGECDNVVGRATAWRTPQTTSENSRPSPAFVKQCVRGLTTVPARSTV
jgi:hypothetical protein